MLLGLEKAEGLTGRAWKDWARSLTASPEHVCGELSAKDCPHPRVQSLVADALEEGYYFIVSFLAYLRRFNMWNWPQGGDIAAEGMERVDEKLPLSLRAPL